MTQENPVVADWPAQSGFYKVIQVSVGDNPYLRFSKTSLLDMDIEQHGNILERFLGENKIPFKRGKGYMPERRGECYELVGAGLCDVNTETRAATFSGKSHGYSVGINPENLDSIRPLQPDWKIEVES